MGWVVFKQPSLLHWCCFWGMIAMTHVALAHEAQPRAVHPSYFVETSPKGTDTAWETAEGERVQMMEYG